MTNYLNRARHELGTIGLLVNTTAFVYFFHPLPSFFIQIEITNSHWAKDDLAIDL
jgi:hypothetical protein